MPINTVIVSSVVLNVSICFLGIKVPEAYKIISSMNWLQSHCDIKGLIWLDHPFAVPLTDDWQFQ